MALPYPRAGDRKREPNPRRRRYLPFWCNAQAHSYRNGLALTIDLNVYRVRALLESLKGDQHREENCILPPLREKRRRVRRKLCRERLAGRHHVWTQDRHAKYVFSVVRKAEKPDRCRELNGSRKF